MWWRTLTHSIRVYTVFGNVSLQVEASKRRPHPQEGWSVESKNYRSVSLLPLFGRMLEKLACDVLMQHVRPALSDAQYGFLTGRSCTTNLAVYLRHAWMSVSGRWQTDVVYTDFSAAFQSVNHKLLLHKLQNSFHIEGHALQWFVSYLSGRTQRVVLNGKTSTWTSVTSGTPEGGILSPLLFCLYVSDLPSVIKSHSLMYADDLKLFRCVRSPADSVALQEDVNWVAEWAEIWKLSLNASKCKSISHTQTKLSSMCLCCARNSVRKVRLDAWSGCDFRQQTDF